MDPNEDTVAAVVGGRAILLVIADGHNGEDASCVAVQTVLDRLGDDPRPADLTEREMLDVFDAANAAVVDAAARADSLRSASGTTLVVALVREGGVQWAAVGDSIACIAAPGRARQLFQPTRQFLGRPPGVALRRASVSCGMSDVPAGAWIIVATDGYSDWAPAGNDLARSTALWTAGAHDAATVVHRLMDKARAGGAGDNVSIAVARA